MSNIKVLGIDLAKDVFQLHGTDAKEKCVLKKRLSRSKLIQFMSQLPSCLVGIEACGGAHYWARLFMSMGHTVKRSAWVADKKQRCGYNKASVAVANKNARIIWAVLATGECYRKAPLIETQVA